MKRIAVYALITLFLIASAASAAVEVVFEDESLNGCIRDILGITGTAAVVTDEMMAGLETIECSDPRIDNLSGMEYAVNLRSFSLSPSGNGVTSLTPLSSLSNLVSVSMPHGQLEDLEGFRTLTGLSSINVSGNAITDIQAIDALPAISALFLDYNDITDISVLNEGTLDATVGSRDFVAGDGGSAAISTDGATFTALATPTTEDITGVACSTGSFVMVDESGGAWYSPIAENFSASSMPVDVALYDIAFVDGRYYAVGSGGTILVSANNGVSFTEATVSTTGVTPVLRGVAGSGSAYVAVGDGGRVYTSNDGLSWGERVNPAGDNLLDVAYGSGTFVAVGALGNIWVSTNNGENWADRSVGGGTLESVSFNAGRFVVVGDAGRIFTSTDGGGTWTPAVSGTNRDLLAVTARDTGFTATGELGLTLNSADGLTWTAAAAPAGATFYAACFGAVVTGSGNIATLSVQGNPVTDITPVATHTGLRILNVRDTGIASLAPVENLVNLVYLNASINRITDLTPLDNLTAMQSLYLSNNEITDLSPLEGLVDLRVLEVMDNAIDNVSLAAGLVNLRRFWFDYNAVTDVSALEDHDSLLEVGMSFNCIEDLYPVRHIDIVRATDQCENPVPEGDSDPGAIDNETGDAVYERVPLESDAAGMSGAGCSALGGTGRLDVFLLLLVIGGALVYVRRS